MLNQNEIRSEIQKLVEQYGNLAFEKKDFLRLKKYHKVKYNFSFNKLIYLHVNMFLYSHIFSHHKIQHRIKQKRLI